MLIARLQNRDPDAVRDLYYTHSGVLKAVVRRIVGNAQTAEDVLQEVLLRIWTHAHLYSPERGEFRAWMLTIARHCAIDSLRSNDGRVSHNGSIGLEQAKWRPAALLDRESLGQAIDRLSPNQRKVVSLAYYEGMSQTQIAHSLKMPLGTVKTWVRTAIGILRQEFCIPAAGK